MNSEMEPSPRPQVSHDKSREKISPKAGGEHKKEIICPI